MRKMVQKAIEADPGTLGSRIREARIGRGLTMRVLAQRLGVSVPTISAIENGRTGVSALRLARLADELQVSMSDFLLVERSDPPAAFNPAGVNGFPGMEWRVFAPLHLNPALTAALATFVEVGYHGATIRVIAQRANLSVPGVYHHYPSKQAMLTALLDITMNEVLARSKAAASEGEGPVARFSHLVECLALYHTYRRELGFIGASEMRSLEPVSRSRVTSQRNAQQRMLDEQVEHGRATGDFATSKPREAGRAVVTMCTGLTQWFNVHGSVTPEEIARQYVGFALGVVEWSGTRRSS